MLTGPGGVSRHVGEDADDADVGQLRHRAPWGEEGLSVPHGAWLGTSELAALSPTCDESTCAAPFPPQVGATPGSLSTYVRLEGSVGGRRDRGLTSSMRGCRGRPRPCLGEGNVPGGVRAIYLFSAHHKRQPP